MKKFRLLAMLLAIVMIVGVFSACGKKSDQVTLVIWGDPDNQAILEDSFKAVNKAFEEKYPEIKLDYQYSGSFDALNVALQSDTLPDLFWVQGNKSSKMNEMATNGYLLPLTDYNFDSSRFPQDAIDYAMVGEDVYSSYPSFIDYVCVYYNKDIFDANGLSKPATWEAFASAAETLKTAGVTPISLGGADEWARYWPIQLMASSLANETLVDIKEGKETPNVEPLVNVFNIYREFSEKGYYGDDVESVDGDSSQLSFSNGQAGMIIDGTWNNSLFKELPFEVGRFALPNSEGTRFSQSGYSNYNTYAVSSKTKFPDEAAKYVEFLNSAESQQVFEDHLGSIPVVDDLKISDSAVAEFSDFQEVGNNVYHVLSQVSTDKNKPQDVFHSKVLAELMTGKITGEEGMQLIMDELNKE